ncbi:MAG TPA: shikimate dehydrogenase [Gemmatimonadaceae bacterium]|nr:shikimate dehydrogenase [Gemmatimonadaceae bacterium]
MRHLPSRLVLLGHPVSHSLSPLLQNAALRSLGLPLAYQAVDVPPDQLTRTMRELSAAGAAGNVTIPHKEAVARLCARLTPLAARVGAVNTFWVEDHHRLVGDNTDVDGFDALVRHAIGAPPSDARVALLGAGGAAAAVLAAIERWDGCEVVLYNRTRRRAEALGRRFGVVAAVADSAVDAVRDARVVVNATSVGSHDDEHPVALDAIQAGTAILDLSYRPGETSWVRAARIRGLRSSDGFRMLLEQGALAFERWLGLPAPRAVMHAALARTSAAGSNLPV